MTSRLPTSGEPWYTLDNGRNAAAETTGSAGSSNVARRAIVRNRFMVKMAVPTKSNQRPDENQPVNVELRWCPETRLQWETGSREQPPSNHSENSCPAIAARGNMTMENGTACPATIQPYRQHQVLHRRSLPLSPPGCLSSERPLVTMAGGDNALPVSY
jgi:hypothetical protein